MPNISGLPELDTVIGLAFMFFLLAVAISAINELIATFLGWRAKTLEDGIRSLLKDPAITKNFWTWIRSLIGRLPKSVTDGLAQEKLMAIQQETSGGEPAGQQDKKLGDLTTTLFENWRIQALVRDPNSESRRRRRPSYLPPEALSRALLEHLAVMGGAEPADAAQAASASSPPETRPPTAPAAATSPAEATSPVPAAAQTPEQQGQPPAGGTPEQPGQPAGPSTSQPQPEAEKTSWQEADEKLFEAIQTGITKIQGGSPAISAALARAVRAPEAKLEAFRVAVEGYFNDTMARASGWYKRKVQWVLLILAVALAAGLNVNTVQIAARLWKEPALRSAVASQATVAVTNPQGQKAPVTAQEAANKIDAVKQLNLPVGWGKVNRPSGFNGWVGAIAGWLITIAAISLGAPFWFDLLSKLARLRGSGPPDTSRPLSDKGAATQTP